MSILRTPEAQFKDLPDYDFAPRYQALTDPDLGGAYQVFLDRVPGTQGQPQVTLHGGHFVQNTDGPRWAQTVVDWIG